MPAAPLDPPDPLDPPTEVLPAVPADELPPADVLPAVLAEELPPTDGLPPVDVAGPPPETAALVFPMSQAAVKAVSVTRSESESVCIGFFPN